MPTVSRNSARDWSTLVAFTMRPRTRRPPLESVTDVGPTKKPLPSAWSVGFVRSIWTVVASAFRAAIAGAGLGMYDSGHGLMVEEMEAFNARIRTFLDSL